jgi:hypothetical protein
MLCSAQKKGNIFALFSSLRPNLTEGPAGLSAVRIREAISVQFISRNFIYFLMLIQNNKLVNTYPIDLNKEKRGNKGNLNLLQLSS